jgi:hypothetical protein
MISESFVSRLPTDPAKRRKLAAGAPEWVQRLLNHTRVRAVQLSASRTVQLRHGLVKQFNRRRIDYRVVDKGDAGDYLVILGADQMIVPRHVFEGFFSLVES